MLAKFTYDFFVNTTAIRSIESASPHPKTGGERTEITWKDGTRKLVDRPIDRLEWATGQIFPAPPGYSVIEASEPHSPGADAIFSTWPVIAFRLTDSTPVPITPLGELSSDQSWALVYPDGRTDSPWDRVFESVDAFKDSYRETLVMRMGAA